MRLIAVGLVLFCLLVIVLGNVAASKAKAEVSVQVNVGKGSGESGLFHDNDKDEDSSETYEDGEDDDDADKKTLEPIPHVKSLRSRVSNLGNRVNRGVRAIGGALDRWAGVCGATLIQRLLIPDHLPGAPSFSPCCQAHDDCYGTCRANKSACDRTLKLCASNKCSSISWGHIKSKAVCSAAALTFYTAVMALGGTAFTNAQTVACK
jgi:hypothetical protein